MLRIIFQAQINSAVFLEIIVIRPLVLVDVDFNLRAYNLKLTVFTGDEALIDCRIRDATLARKKRAVFKRPNKGSKNTVFYEKLSSNFSVQVHCPDFTALNENLF